MKNKNASNQYKWAYFQPAGDSGINKRSGSNIGIGCSNNGNRSSGTSNFQRPIITCLNDAKDQHQHQTPTQPANPNYNANLMQTQNQQHQVLLSFCKIDI